MPFTEHPVFKSPNHGDCIIWRYIDFTKLISMLEDSCLFFSRIDVLEDLYEGYFTKMNVTWTELDYDQLPDQFKSDYQFPDEKLWKFVQESHKKIREVVKVSRLYTFVNCWHAQDYESAAMWSQYIKSGDGIAIKSSYKNLIEALSETEKYTAYIGIVEYIDYDNEAIPIGNLLSPFMYKRRSFEHEKELRCLIHTPDYEKIISKQDQGIDTDNPRGLSIRVSLDKLIDEIYISPNAPDWHSALIEKLLIRYELTKPVINSRLSERPIY